MDYFFLALMDNSFKSRGFKLICKINLINNIRKLGTIDFRYLKICNIICENHIQYFISYIYFKYTRFLSAIRKMLPEFIVIPVKEICKVKIDNVLYEFGLKPGLVGSTPEYKCKIDRNFYKILNIDRYLLSNIDLESEEGYRENVVYYIYDGDIKEKIKQLLDFNDKSTYSKIYYNTKRMNFVGSAFNQIGLFYNNLPINLFIRLLQYNRYEINIGYKVLIIVGEESIDSILDKYQIYKDVWDDKVFEFFLGMIKDFVLV